MQASLSALTPSGTCSASACRLAVNAFSQRNSGQLLVGSFLFVEIVVSRTISSRPSSPAKRNLGENRKVTVKM
jgi:hypothetical protein